VNVKEWGDPLLSLGGVALAKNIASAVWALAAPVAQNLGYLLWDVEFVREGAAYYLRVYIDRAEGVRLEDCEAMSRALDPVLDEADPIEQSYCLEVSSPGIERRLSRPEHFEAMKGRQVVIKLYTLLNGKKEVTGVLVGLQDGEILLEPLVRIAQKAAASVRLAFMD